MSTVHSDGTKGGRVWVWPAIIVGMLALQVVLCVIGVMAARRGQAAAVEEDYYNKALRWDEQQQRRQASAALGWKTELRTADAAAAGQRTLTLTVADNDGNAVRGATVKLVAFHHAHPQNVLEGTLREAEPGVYAVTMPMPRAGVWEFRLTATRGKDVFMQTTQRELRAVAAQGE